MNQNARYISRRAGGAQGRAGGAGYGAGYTAGRRYDSGRGYGMSSGAFAVRGHNSVRHAGTNRLGPVSSAVILGALVIVMGLIYVAQGTKATSYDYELSAVQGEISELEARRDDLAVEQARATSIAASKNSQVAAAMEEATVAGYVAE